MTIRKDNGRRAQQVKGVAKQLDDTGGESDLTLLISTDAQDDEGDIVEQEWEIPSQVPVLFAHKNTKLPVGHVTSLETMSIAELPPAVRRELSDGARRATVADVDFDDGDEFAQSILRKYRRGDIEDSSVGFDPIEFEELEGDEGRFRFLRSELKELSVVAIGANSDTTVLSKAFDPDVLPAKLRRKAPDDFPSPPESVRDACRTGLRWHEEGYSGDGIEESTVEWARKMADGQPPSEDKALKMGSWFSRHLAQDAPLRDEDDDPTPKAVSIKLWGGKEAGPAYTRRLYRRMEREIPDGLAELDGAVDVTRAEPDELEVGDFVRWGSGGGDAQGEIENIVRDGTINVPDSEFTINGTEDDPAALIRIYDEVEDGWVPTDTLVGHRFSTLEKIDDLPLADQEESMDGERDTDADEGKEGRRNSRMDKACMEHMEELAGFLQGKMQPDEMKPCPFHDQQRGGMDGDKSHDLSDDELDRLAGKVAEKMQDEDETQRHDREAGEPLTIDGEETELRIVDTEQPGGSPGDAGDGETSEIDLNAL
jgi:HK97 family phage prohead protease